VTADSNPLAPSPQVRLGSRSVPIILALLIIAGLAFRVHTAIGRYEKGDSIIVALMANDIARGVEYPLWYYGGPYAGALESWLTAPLIWATGPTWWAIPFVPILVSTAGIAAFYMLGSAIGGARAGLFAGALWAFAPWGASFYNTSPRGCYPETICGGAMIIWYATVRWKGEPMSIAVSLMTGLLAGVLIWSRLLVAPYVITLALVLLLVDRAKIFNIRNMAGVAGILAGALPFLFAWKKVTTQTAVGKIEISGMGERVRALYATLLDGYAPGDGAEHAWATPASWASLALSLAATFVFIAIAAFPLTRRAKPWREIKTVPLALFTLIFSAIYLSNTASLTSQVRYALPLYTAILVFPALAADWLAGRSRVLGVAVIIFLAGSATVASQLNFAAVRKDEAPIRDQARAIVTQLQNLGAHSVIVNDYNLMERLYYEALTRGYVLDTMEVNGNLNARWTMAVERDTDPVHLIHPGQVGQFAQWLKSCCGGEYANQDFAGLAGIHQIKTVTWPSVSIPPAQWKISTNGQALADRVHATTFCSNARQEVIIAFERPRNLTRVRLVYGNRFPQTVTLDRGVDGDSWERISGPQSPSMLYPVGGRVYRRIAGEFDHEHEEWNFPPKPATRLRITFDPHDVDPYDLHELFVYESSDETYPEPSPEEIRRAAEKEGVSTLALDRRTASFFYGAGGPLRGTSLSFVEANPQLAQAQWKTGPGFAALVDRADALELTERLKGRSFAATPLGNKIMFAFKKDSGLMWWTGFTLIGAP
jgi:hypothetical protein